MACQLLHIVEVPDPEAYDDPDLRDVVGCFPSCYCARSTPVSYLKPGEVVICLERDTPCSLAFGLAQEP